MDGNELLDVFEPGFQRKRKISDRGSSIKLRIPDV